MTYDKAFNIFEKWASRFVVFTGISLVLGACIFFWLFVAVLILKGLGFIQ